MIKSIINDLAIRMHIIIIITLSQFMKSAQYFLFLLSHLLFCITSLLLQGMSLTLPIISKIFIKAICMAYFWLSIFLRRGFWPSFVLELLILGFMDFGRLVMCNLRHFHMTKGFYDLVDIWFCFFPLMDI